MFTFKGIHTLIIIGTGMVDIPLIGSPRIKHSNGISIWKVIGEEREVEQLKNFIEKDNLIVNLILDKKIEKPLMEEFKTTYCPHCCFLEPQLEDYCIFESFSLKDRLRLLEDENNRKHISNCSLYRSLIEDV